ncbi:MAG: Spy/CpxP family protein refolding chaperone [Alphaproteobacteria bacterium]|jgi:protein CpxP|nr:Spy/CpxP family protein refolding chaperone [Alphaproteobacteria bacterium]
MTDETKPTRRGFGYVALIGAVIVGLAGGLATSALGHGGGFGPRHWGGGPGGGWGGHHRMHGPVTQEQAKEHATHMVDRFARHIDATAEQKQKLMTIATALATDMQPLHQKMQEARKRGIELLRQPTVDRAAVETFRAEQIASADVASKRLSQALADAADVLTPEQRTKIAAHWDR